MAPSDEGLLIHHTWSGEAHWPVAEISRLQTSTLHHKSVGFLGYWAPGLQRDCPMNPDHWGIKTSKGPPKPLTKVEIRDLYQALPPWSQPPIWDWWQAVGSGEINTPPKWRGWQKLFINGSEDDFRSPAAR